MNEDHSIDHVESVLRSDGVDVIEAERISSSVYLVRLDSGRGPTVRYVKVIPDGMQSRFDRLVELGGSIGMPVSHIVDGRPSVQVMRPADGRQLSHVLVTSLLPGIYHRRRESLVAGFRNLGRYAGRLYTETTVGRDRIAIADLHLDKYDAITEDGLDERLVHELSPETVDAVQRFLSQHHSIETPRSTVHGDLILSHVYYADGDVQLIDFDRTTVAASLVDYVSLDCTLELMVRRLPWGRREQLTDLRSAFGEGYRDVAGHEPAGQLVDALRVVKFCSLLLYYLEVDESLMDSMPPSSAALTKPIDTRVLKRRIAALTEDPPDSRMTS